MTRTSAMFRERGDHVAAGQPIYAVLAVGSDDATCYAMLVERAERIYASRARRRGDAGSTRSNTLAFTRHFLLPPGNDSRSSRPHPVFSSLG